MSNLKRGETSSNCKVVPFKREAGYYLKKGMFYYQKNKLSKSLIYLRKATEVEPGNAYNHYNLACLLSKLGQLEEANRIFHYIIQELDDSITDCYFLLAINYGLMENMVKSREYLHHYLEVDPEGEMAFEASELLEALDDDPPVEPVYTSRDLTLEKMLRSESREALINLYNSSDSFCSALNDRLYHGSDEFKEDIIKFYGLLGGTDACKVLRDFIKNPWIKERFRQLALLELKNLVKEGKIQIFFDGELCEMDLNSYPVDTPVWRPEWQKIVDCTMENMRRSNCYEEGFFDDVQAIWLDYINTVYPNVPRITKNETWAAALEYCLVRFHFLNLTQKELAKEYGISPGSISNRFRAINEALQIDHKAYQNMIAYLKGTE